MRWTTFLVCYLLIPISWSFHHISSAVWIFYRRYLEVTLTVSVLIALAAVIKKDKKVNPLVHVKKLVDDRIIYASIENYLRPQLPDRETRVECIMGEIRDRNFAAEFYTFDIVFNRKEVIAKTQAALNYANLTCILKSPENVSELADIFLLPILLLIFSIVVFVSMIRPSLKKLVNILSGNCKIQSHDKIDFIANWVLCDRYIMKFILQTKLLYVYFFNFGGLVWIVSNNDGSLSFLSIWLSSIFRKICIEGSAIFWSMIFLAVSPESLYISVRSLA